MVTLLGSDAYTEAFIETLRTGMRGQILLSAEQRDLMARFHGTGNRVTGWIRGAFPA